MSFIETNNFDILIEQNPRLGIPYFDNITKRFDLSFKNENEDT